MDTLFKANINIALSMIYFKKINFLKIFIIFIFIYKILFNILYNFFINYYKLKYFLLNYHFIKILN